MNQKFPKDLQYYKFCGYGFFKNLRFFDPFIMLFFREMGLSFFSIGILFSVREIGINIFEVPSGALADLLGRRRAMLFSFFFFMVSFALFYLLGGVFAVAVAAMVFYALADTLRSGTHKAMILEYLKIKELLPVKVIYYGSTRACSQYGSAISAVIAASLVYWGGEIRIVFLASMVPYLIDFLLLYSYPKNLDGIRKGEKISFSIFFNFLWGSIKLSFQETQLRRVVLNTSIISASFKFSKDYLQPVIQSSVLLIPFLLHMPQAKKTAILIGLVYSVIYLISAMASKNAYRFQGKNETAQNALNINFTINAGLYFTSGLFLFYGWYAAAILAFILIFVIQNFTKPIMVGYLSEIVESKRMATVLSIENQSRAVFVMIFAPLVGWLVDLTSIGGGFVVYGAVLLLISFLIKIK